MGQPGSKFDIPESQVPILIHVKTGDRKGAGTDATVKIRLYDSKGVATNELKLSRFWHNDHERGQLETFPLSADEIPKTFGELYKLELWRDSFGLGSSWYLDLITIEERVSRKMYHFPAQRWINADTHYILRHFDTCLPQFDDQLYQRQLELETKRKIYEYVINSPGLPAQVKRLPEDECFSDSYKWDIVSNKLQFIKDAKLISLTTGIGELWESWEELNKVYKKSKSMEMPLGAKDWRNDLRFGSQRVQGCNPVLLCLCKEIPANFPLDLKLAEQIMDKVPVLEMIARNRLFIVNLKILDNLPCSENRTVCAPIALFYLDKNKNLLPVAIQLFQRSSPTNPIFYPTDNPNTWLLAKMWYNNADASYHQSCTHLGFTHLLMEGVAVCTHRNLSPSHPLFKLLAPHFLFLLAINTRGLQKLINAGGWVDKTTTIGRTGMFELISRGVKQWRLETDAVPPVECARRGVADPNILPVYPYRDDAIAIFSAIKEYVTAVIENFYDSIDKILEDKELQSWARELVLSKSHGGCGIKGVPGEGKFTSVSEIITTMSAIICTCSVAHAAANFNQYDEYGFPPNYPAFLAGDIPTKKEGYSDRDILLQLPTKSITLDTMVVTRLLSSKGTNSLGEFEVQYLYDPVSISAAKQFRQSLKAIGAKIRSRNLTSTTLFSYPWLDPDIVPNSISI